MRSPESKVHRESKYNSGTQIWTELKMIARLYVTRHKASTPELSSPLPLAKRSFLWLGRADLRLSVPKHMGRTSNPIVKGAARDATSLQTSHDLTLHTDQAREEDSHILFLETGFLVKGAWYQCSKT